MSGNRGRRWVKLDVGVGKIFFVGLIFLEVIYFSLFAIEMKNKKTENS